MAALVTAAWGGCLGTDAAAWAGGWLATSDGVAGQPWRLVLSPWIHADWGHFWRDVPIWAALAWGVRKERHLPLLMLLSLAIPSLAVVLQPTLDGYMGLSGAINTLLVVFVARSAPRSPVARLLGAALGGKLLYEGLTGHLLFPLEMADGVVAAPLAHLVGAGVGLLWILVSRARGHARPAMYDRRPEDPWLHAS